MERDSETQHQLGKNYIYTTWTWSCTAELFECSFHTFEAGIADTTSSFKWMKNNIIYKKNRRLLIWIIWSTEHPPQDTLH